MSARPGCRAGRNRCLGNPGAQGGETPGQRRGKRAPLQAAGSSSCDSHDSQRTWTSEKKPTLLAGRQPRLAW